MIIKRQDLEQQEYSILAPYAMKAASSRGRDIQEPESEFRTCFQRDIDRIVHSKAFRRLEYKTQVFVNYEGDHYRTRLTHTFEVSRVAGSICRALGLNAELAEAIALAHDLGHTPFGHAGEGVLNEITQSIGGFEHNRQSLRVVEKLEIQYPDFIGLNLTWEVREGMLKHASVYDQPQIDRFNPDQKISLEGQVVNISDELSYNCHDLEDGLRSGILTPQMLDEVSLWSTICQQINGKKLDDYFLRHRAVRFLKDMLVNDVVTSSGRAIENLNISSPEDARNHSDFVIQFSQEMRTQLRTLSRFLLDHFYFHHRLVRMTTKAKWILKNLFLLYVDNPKLLPSKVLERGEKDEPIERKICDYVAGMTDRFALEEYRKLADPSTGFSAY